MRASSPLRLIGLLALAGALPYAAASCSEPKGEQALPASIDDVLLKDGATRAALTNFVNVFPTPWDWGAPFSSPMDGDVLHYPATFSYSVDVSVCSKNPGGDTGEAGANSEGPAFNTDGTFSGEAYLLEFNTAQNPPFLRVFTGSAHYAPTQAEWQKLVAAGSQPIFVTVSTASFESDRVTTTCGPFLGQTISFTIQ